MGACVGGGEGVLSYELKGAWRYVNLTARPTKWQLQPHKELHNPVLLCDFRPDESACCAVVQDRTCMVLRYQGCKTCLL
jgi:hypothetical protein